MGNNINSQLSSIHIDTVVNFYLYCLIHEYNETLFENELPPKNEKMNSLQKKNTPYQGSRLGWPVTLNQGSHLRPSLTLQTKETSRFVYFEGFIFNGLSMSRTGIVEVTVNPHRGP